MLPHRWCTNAKRSCRPRGPVQPCFPTYYPSNEEGTRLECARSAREAPALPGTSRRRQRSELELVLEGFGREGLDHDLRGFRLDEHRLPEHLPFSRLRGRLPAGLPC